VKRRTQFRLLVALTIVWAIWAGWSLIGRATPYHLRVIDDLGVPVAGAVVDIDGEQAGTTAVDGIVDLRWRRSGTVLEVSAPGHVTRKVTVNDRPETTLDLVLTARVLGGRVVDAEGNAVESALVETSSGAGISDADGRFMIRGAEPGEVTVQRPAWTPTVFEWDGSPGDTEVTIEQFTARAVHISGEAVRDHLGEFVDMAMATELNSLMIDLKDETGKVFYVTQNPTAIEVGANTDAYDLQSVVTTAHENDLYVIGRLVLFNDPIAAVNKPEMAVWDAQANTPFHANGQYFLDPTDPDARQYGLDLAVEACSMGVDEIQFDYVRFPDARTDTTVFDEGVSDDVRLPTITQFLGQAVAMLHPMGCAVGADIFGFLTTHTGDGGIGQRWEDISLIVDVVSPMVYPSHYDSGWFGFEVPNDNPGPMVMNALEDGMARLPRNVVVRPWLQDFGYNATQVREQITSTETFGLGWMLWNAESNVTTSALQPDG
jgi:hypothetical protein